jgi:hypothetical protein
MFEVTLEVMVAVTLEVTPVAIPEVTLAVTPVVITEVTPKAAAKITGEQFWRAPALRSGGIVVRASTVAKMRTKRRMIVRQPPKQSVHTPSRRPATPRRESAAARRPDHRRTFRRHSAARSGKPLDMNQIDANEEPLSNAEGHARRRYRALREVTWHPRRVDPRNASEAGKGAVWRTAMAPVSFLHHQV